MGLGMLLFNNAMLSYCSLFFVAFVAIVCAHFGFKLINCLFPSLKADANVDYLFDTVIIVISSSQKINRGCF